MLHIYNMSSDDREDLIFKALADPRRRLSPNGPLRSSQIDASRLFEMDQPSRGAGIGVAGRRHR